MAAGTIYWNMGKDLMLSPPEERTLVSELSRRFRIVSRIGQDADGAVMPENTGMRNVQ